MPAALHRIFGNRRKGEKMNESKRIIWIDNVKVIAMIAGIPIVETIKPFNSPINVAISKEQITAAVILNPLFTIRYAQTTFTIVIMEPVERSIPAIRITNVIPIAAIPYIETCLAIVNILFIVRNLSFAIAKPINKITNTNQMAFSFN